MTTTASDTDDWAASPSSTYPVDLAVRGAMLTAVGTALYLVLGTIVGEPNAPGFAVPMLLALGCAWLIPRKGWVLPAAGVAAAVALAGLTFDPFRLTHPDNFLDFASPIVTAAGLAAILAGAVLQLARLRGRTESAVKVVARVCAGLLALTVAASGALTLAPSGGVGAGGDVVVVTEKSGFEPTDIEVRSGGTIVVRNLDWFAHTFTVFDLGISEYIPPRGERPIDLPDAKLGTYELTCAVVGHWGMDGRLTIEREP